MPPVVGLLAQTSKHECLGASNERTEPAIGSDRLSTRCIRNLANWTSKRHMFLHRHLSMGARSGPVIGITTATTDAMPPRR